MYEQPGASSAVVTGLLYSLARSVSTLPEPTRESLLDDLRLHIETMTMPSEGDAHLLRGLHHALTVYVDQAVHR